MKIKYIFLFLFFSNWHFNLVFSSNIKGGEISYEWVSDKKYEINFNVYRNCKSQTLPNGKLYMFVNNDSFELSFERISIERVLPICNKNNDACFPQNTFSKNDGIEKHRFKGYVNLDDAVYSKVQFNSICYVYFGFKCGKTTTTVFEESSSNFYIECMLNVCGSNQNSSPKFYENKIFNNQCNQAFKIEFTAFDSLEYDSIVYEQFDALNSHNRILKYRDLYSKKTPMTPFCPPNPGTMNCKPLPNTLPTRGCFFSSETGTNIITTTNCGEISLISILAKEYREINHQKVLIGYSNIIRVIEVVEFKDFVEIIRGSDQIKTNYNNKKIVQNYSTSFFKKDYTKFPVDSFYLVNKPNWIDYKVIHYSNSSVLELTVNFPIDLISQSKKCPDFYDLIMVAQMNDCNNPTFKEMKVRVYINSKDKFTLLQTLIYNDEDKDNIKDDFELAKKGDLFIKNLENNKTTIYPVEANDMLYLPFNKFEVKYKYKPYELGKIKLDSFNVKYYHKDRVEYPVQHKSGIYGYVYFDKNKNGYKDQNDIPLNNILIKTQNEAYGYSNIDGFYYIDVPEGKYVLQAELLDNRYINFGNVNVELFENQCSYNNDIMLLKGENYNEDLSLFIKSNIQINRGSSDKIKIEIHNIGNVQSNKTKLVLDFYKNTEIKMNSFDLNINIGEIDIPSLEPNQIYKKEFDLIVNPNLFIRNDNLLIKAKILNSDDNKENNEKEILIKVVAPHDPNDISIISDTFKTVLDNKITYQIRFQNTGDVSARNVLVTDTLDMEFFNLEKFKLESLDFPCSVYFIGNVIHFYFEGINLPPLKTHGIYSIFTFNFTIGLKTKVNQEKRFKKRVSIFFDFEDPIITNWSIGNIVSPIELKKSNQIWCTNQEQKVLLQSKFKLLDETKINIELSDEFGQFNQHYLLENYKFKQIDSLFFTLPQNLNTGNYKLRTTTVFPTTSNISESGIINIKIQNFEPKKTTTNLINNEICSNIPLMLKFEKNDYSFEIKKNKTLLPIQNSLEVNLGYPIENDIFEIIIKSKDGICKSNEEIIPNVISIPDLNVKIVNPKVKYCIYDTVYFQLKSDNQILSIINGNQETLNQQNTILPLLMNQDKTISFISKNQKGCLSYSDTHFLYHNPNPISEFDVEKNINKSKSISLKLSPKNKNYYSYQWFWEQNNRLTKDSTRELTIHSTSESPIKIRLKTKDSFGCQSETSETIKTKLYPQVYIPNSISFSNKDHLNDCLTVITEDTILNYHIEIYNNWGQKVFEQKNLSSSWCPDLIGNYTYIIYFKDLDDYQYKFTGVITVL